MPAFLRNEEHRTIFYLLLSSASLAISFFASTALYSNFAWIAIILCGLPIVSGALQGLITEFDIKADVLVSIALIASVIIGEVFAAGEIALIMALGAYLEDRTVARARAGIEQLVKLTPATARVLRDNTEVIIPAAEVLKGDTLRVLPGETIAVDGKIIHGETSINQAVMTGESLPVDKVPGDEVLSGTTNQFGSFDMQALKIGTDSSLQRLIRLVESADAGKAKIVGMADRWATWIVIVALSSAIITWLATGEIIRAVTILVVFCPCALVLATPTAIMAGIGNASKYGILISEGDALERLAQVKRFVFDKTGTLTHGKPSVVEIKCAQNNITLEELLGLAASAELRSEHPLGKAILTHYREVFSANPSQPEFFELLPGRGVKAIINGSTIYAGNESILLQFILTLTDSLRSFTVESNDSGSTLIYIIQDSNLLGIIALADTLRSLSPETIRTIENSGMKTLLLTGDSEHAARHIAGFAGINDVQANCLPEDKLNTIQKYQQNGEPVCMIGDGINDAPALRASQVGIAMGNIGSDIAIDAADITLVGDDISNIPHLVQLSHKVMRTIKFNLTASMLLNFIAIVLAVTGILNPILGALVHNAGSVAVIINSSFLLKWRKEAVLR